MSEICTKCGLPTELCVCETIAKESVKIRVRTIKKKFGKVYTEITGVDEKNIDAKEVAKKLKNKFACGGTAKKGIIELQGDHLDKIKNALVELGFAEETIEVEERWKGKRNSRR
ncbi:stress response translation initiation inhibitor YciH [Candidatus Woesearchaeota archaeon]|nr:MAG: stress response translation initiation inhibitor YciH [Candidatus Woesearchaeota archaeon]